MSNYKGDERQGPGQSFYHKLDGVYPYTKRCEGSRGNIYVLIRDVELGAPDLAPADLPAGGFDGGFRCESEPCRRNGTFDGLVSSLFELLVEV